MGCPVRACEVQALLSPKINCSLVVEVLGESTVSDLEAMYKLNILRVLAATFCPRWFFFGFLINPLFLLIKTCML